MAQQGKILTINADGHGVIQIKYSFLMKIAKIRKYTPPLPLTVAGFSARNHRLCPLQCWRLQASQIDIWQLACCICSR